MLGRLHFLLYIKAYLRKYTHLSACSQLILQFTSQSAMNQTLKTLQQDLDTLPTWKRLWDMNFNPCKCWVLHITKSRHPAQHIYMLHGQALEAPNHAKYLGVDSNKDLSWNTHINRITANANRTLGFLKWNIKTQHTGIRTLVR